MFLWPWLEGIPSLKKAPLTWLLIFLNVIAFVLVEPQQIQHADKIEKIFSSEFKTKISLEYKKYLSVDDKEKTLEKSSYMKPEVAQIFLVFTAMDDLLFKTFLKERNPEISRAIDEIEHLQKTFPKRQYVLRKDRIGSLTLLTHIFTHSGWSHLIFNMIFFVFFGAVIENLVGKTIFLSVYFLIGIASSVIYLSFSNSVGVLGASGAISAIFGLWFGLEKSKPARYFYFILPFSRFYGFFSAPAWFAIIFWVFTDIVDAFTSHDNVAYGLHLINFVIGFLVSFYVDKKSTISFS